MTRPHVAPEALRRRSGIIHGTRPGIAPEILREEHGAWIRELGTRDQGPKAPSIVTVCNARGMDGRSAAFGGVSCP